MPDHDTSGDRLAVEQDVTHAGHPVSADRWCVDDVCDAQVKAAQAIKAGADELDVFRGRP